MMMKRVSLAIVVVAGLFSGQLFAQTGVKSTVPDMKRSEAPQGWSYEVKAALGGNFNRLESVPGKETGNTVTVNASVDAGLKYMQGSNEWRNMLSLIEAVSRTPSLPENVLTTDRLKLSSLYLYKIAGFDWLSPFASFDLETNVFVGQTFSPTPVTVQNLDGSTEATNTTKFRLTDPFGVLTLKESVGGIARLWKTKTVSGEFRLGLAALQIMADDQLTLKDDADTATLEVVSLNSSRKLGLDGILTIKGEVWEKKFSYLFYAAFFGPFTVDSDLDDVEDGFTAAATTEYGMKLAYNPLEWLSLSYEVRNFREPLIVDDHQITHNFLATVSYKTSGQL